MIAQSNEVAITLGQAWSAIAGVSIALNTFFLKGVLSELKSVKETQNQHAVDIAVLKVTNTVKESKEQ